MPAVRIAEVQRWVSAFTKAAASSGVEVETTIPKPEDSLSRKSAYSPARRTAAFRRETAMAGVPAGTKSPNQAVI